MKSATIFLLLVLAGVALAQRRGRRSCYLPDSILSFGTRSRYSYGTTIRFSCQGRLSLNSTRSQFTCGRSWPNYFSPPTCSLRRSPGIWYIPVITEEGGISQQLIWILLLFSLLGNNGNACNGNEASLGAKFGGSLPDSAFTTNFVDPLVTPLGPASFGRLDTPASTVAISSGWSGWIGKPDADYLQVDLGENFIVTSVTTQGGLQPPPTIPPTNNVIVYPFTPTFELAYAADGGSFAFIMDGVGNKEFVGSSTTPPGTLVTTLPNAISARYIRFYPVNGNIFIGFPFQQLRVDIHGCERRGLF